MTGEDAPVSSQLSVSLGVMTCHDFLFYASRDYGAVAQPADFIGNYALMYAMNRHIPKVRRLIDGVVPHYEEDLRMMPLYATPAAFVDDFPHDSSMGRNWIDVSMLLGASRDGRWHRRDMTRITWNSVGASLLEKMEQDNINMPKKGAYYQHPPLASFYFYVVGERLPSVFRVGKKYSPVRASFHPLEMEEKSGRFSPTCPVTVDDLPAETRILRGSLLTVPPTPVLTLSELDGAYIEGKDSNGLVHRFPVPDREKYEGAWS